MARLWPCDGAMERELIILEWQRGLLSSRAAVGLTRAGLYADAISRAYYAIFHATKATVLTKEIEPTTHQAAGSLLNQHLIYTANWNGDGLPTSRTHYPSGWMPNTMSNWFSLRALRNWLAVGPRNSPNASGFIWKHKALRTQS